MRLSFSFLIEPNRGISEHLIIGDNHLCNNEIDNLGYINTSFLFSANFEPITTS